jgi:hypothetical protein
MFVVIDNQGYFVSQLHNPDDENKSRPDVFEMSDREGLTDDHQYVDGQWVEPEIAAPAPEPGYEIARPPAR